MVDSTISYELHKGNIRVRLGRRLIGVIRKDGDNGYHYKPNGGPAGETMESVAAVKRSIEAP